MAEKLGDRIVLVGRLLTALKSVGGAAYAWTSELQAAAVKGLLLQASLSLEQSTEIVESIVAVPLVMKKPTCFAVGRSLCLSHDMPPSFV